MCFGVAGYSAVTTFGSFGYGFEEKNAKSEVIFAVCHVL